MVHLPLCRCRGPRNEIEEKFECTMIEKLAKIRAIITSPSRWTTPVDLRLGRLLRWISACVFCALRLSFSLSFSEPIIIKFDIKDKVHRDTWLTVPLLLLSLVASWLDTFNRCLALGSVTSVAVVFLIMVAWWWSAAVFWSLACAVDEIGRVFAKFIVVDAVVDIGTRENWSFKKKSSKFCHWTHLMQR